MVADIAKDANKAGEGAQESEEWRNSGGDFQKDETGFKTGDFVTGAGLNGIKCLGTGPVLVL